MPEPKSSIHWRVASGTPRLKNPTGAAIRSIQKPTHPSRVLNRTVSRIRVELFARKGQAELTLLNKTAAISDSDSHMQHQLRTAPVMTRGALLAAGLTGEDSQYGVFGQVLSMSSCAGLSEDPRLYFNTNAPFSALVCGVQGSGKSHTVCTMLESMFVEGDRRIGVLSKPLCGLVLHLSEGGIDSSPSEAAWLGTLRPLQPKEVIDITCSDSSSESARTSPCHDISMQSVENPIPPQIRILVSPSSISTMRKVYSQCGSGVSVEPLQFLQRELDADAFLSMMAIDASDQAPLYIQIVLSILRKLGEKYTYAGFKAELEMKKKDFNPAQLNGLKQRMALLEAFISPKDEVASRFAPGQLTIVDLSDPFIDSASACGIFQTVLRLFVRVKVETGKILVVDEAHKYLTTGDGASGLTKNLLTLIREQRHKAMRVIISTQEPTVVPPVLIDLCNMIVLHRFSSPAWWTHIKHHVSADLTSDEAFNQVLHLQTGEAIILSPSGLFLTNTPDSSEKVHILGQLGRIYLHVRTRRRITQDGGASIMVL